MKIIVPLENNSEYCTDFFVYRRENISPPESSLNLNVHTIPKTVNSDCSIDFTVFWKLVYWYALALSDVVDAILCGSVQLSMSLSNFSHHYAGVESNLS